MENEKMCIECREYYHVEAIGKDGKCFACGDESDPRDLHIYPEYFRDGISKG